MGRLCVSLAAAWLLAVPAAAQVTPASGATARDAYERALALEAGGQFDAALALLWYAAGAAPRDAEVLNHLGEALNRIGAIDGAVDAFERAIAGQPGFRTAWNNLVLALAQAGRGPEAVARARTAVAAAPNDPDPQFTLGLALSEQDVDASIAAFRRVLELSPDHALAQFNLALVLKRADRFPEAVTALTRAIAAGPRPEMHYQLGVIAWQQGQLTRAVTALREAVAADPRYADAYYTLGAVLAARGDAAEAAAALRRAIALRPMLPGAHDTLARALLLLGDRDAAAVEFAAAEQLRRQAQLEREAGTWTAVGARRLTDGDLTGALDQFRRATTILDTYAPAHFQIGLVLQRLGEPDAARAAFARAAQLNPALTAPPPAR